MAYYHGGPGHSYVAVGPSTSSGGRSSRMDPDSTYSIEHLATFTVNSESGSVYPADGMRRLVELEKSNGIWSQKMQLRLERDWVLIMDNETGAVMERFPVALIQEPTAFTTQNPMEMYNNILVFTVGDDSASGQSAEMHIFQCQSVSAQDLVEDLKMLQMGKLVPGVSPREPRREIPPPPNLPPPEPPLNGVNVREKVSAFNAANHNEGPIDGSREDNNDEASSTSSEKYERDVAVLNHCFDDIEKFIARLQHSAAASRELERRRRTSKSKKRNLGDGMLTMRAKPPPEMEFFDIFQKFKLSFNLLAKLKAHIHDPNAPELVHFLFTPLALIVDAAQDITPDVSLPFKVVAPLLTREAVNLLIHCVTSKETELWHSLGDTWLVPSDQWKGSIPPYHPTFMDGWTPEFPVTEDHRDNDHLATLLNADKQKRDEVPEQMNDPYYSHRDVEESHYSSDYLEFENREERGNEYFDRNYGAAGSEHYPREERVDQARAHSDISVDSIERAPRTAAIPVGRAQEVWLEDLLVRQAKIVQVTYPRTANNDKELTVSRGEYLEILDDNRKWWKARNSKGQIAHVPHTIVTQHGGGAYQGGDSAVFNNPLYGSRYQRQGRGYNYEDSEMEGTSSSPGPEAVHRPHGIPPPAPVDWVRKERLGKKDCSVRGIRVRDDELRSAPPSFSPRTIINIEESADQLPRVFSIRPKIKKSNPLENDKISGNSGSKKYTTSYEQKKPARFETKDYLTPDFSKLAIFEPKQPELLDFESNEPVTFESKKPVTFQSKELLTFESKEPICYQPKPVTFELKKPVTFELKKPVTFELKKPVVFNSRKPLTIESKTLVTFDSKNPVIFESKDPLTLQPKNLVNLQPKKPEVPPKPAMYETPKSVPSRSRKVPIRATNRPPTPPPLPPPPPQPSPATPLTPATPSCSTWSSCGGSGRTRRKTSPIGIKVDSYKSMKEELQAVLALLRGGKKKNTNVSKILNLNINDRSTREDVRIWLRSKGFSDTIQQTFHGYNGAKMFELTIGELEFKCGYVDGSRLNGEINHSRHLEPYFNTQPGEIRHIIEKTRRNIPDPK